MGLKLITAPADYPVTLAELQKHCEAPEPDHEAILEICRKAATEHAEEFTGRAFIEQTWDLYIDEFPEDYIRVPKPPLIEVVGIYYRDSAGAEQALSADIYIVDDASEPARIALAYGEAWPTIQTRINAVRVRFKAGYINDASPAAANVPFPIKAAIKMIAGSLFVHRETIVIGQTATLLPGGAEIFLRRYKVDKSMA